MHEIVDLKQSIIELVSLMPNIKRYQLLRMLEDWRQGQNREDYREACFIPVDISAHDRVYRDFINNFSKSGAFVETRQPFAKGEPVCLVFSSPNGRRHYKVRGIVIRNEAKGVAVKFHQKIGWDRDEKRKKSHGPLLQIVN
jgi:Tfp pilus assembly protein PilZ